MVCFRVCCRRLLGLVFGSGWCGCRLLCVLVGGGLGFVVGGFG